MAVRICCLYVANVSRVTIDTRKASRVGGFSFLIRQGLAPRLVAAVPPIEPFSYATGNHASQEGEDKETAKEESP